MNPKRRRRLALVAIGIMAGVLGVSVGQKNAQDYLPCLVLVEQQQVEGQRQVVVFRFEGPKYGSSELLAVSTQNPSTGQGRRLMRLDEEGDVFGEPLEAHTARWPSCFPLFMAVTGVSPEFRIIPPPDAVWRLRCEASIAHPIGISTWIRELPSSVKSCWQKASFRPLRSRRWVTETVILESEPVTNAVVAVSD